MLCFCNLHLTDKGLTVKIQNPELIVYWFQKIFFLYTLEDAFGN